MGISLGGVSAWTVDEQIPPGTYLVRPAPDGVERDKSSNKNEQVKINWRIAAGEYTGAERNDWVTFTEAAMGRVVQLLEACSIPVPTDDFKSFGDLADWTAEQLKKPGVQAMAVVRLKEDRKGATNADGSPKMWPEIVGYKVPTDSDVPPDGVAGFGPQPNVNGGGDKEKLPF